MKKQETFKSVLNMSDKIGKRKDEMIETLASRLHDNWRRARGFDNESSNLYVPREKVYNDSIYDIANLTFTELPKEAQKENLEASRIALDGIFETENRGDIVSESWLEKEAKETHSHWVMRNVKSAPECLMCNYEDLDEMEQKKDRNIVLEALRVYSLYFPDSSILKLEDNGDDFIPDENELHEIIFETGKILRNRREKTWLVDIDTIDHPEIYTALYFDNLKTGKETCLRGYRYGSGAVCTSVCDDIRLCLADRKYSIQMMGRILKEERIRNETKLEPGYYSLNKIVSGSCRSSTRGTNSNIGLCLDTNSSEYELFDSTVFEYDGASFHIVPDKIALKILLGMLLRR